LAHEYLRTSARGAVEWLRIRRRERGRVESDFERNRRAWDRASDDYQQRHGPQLTAQPQAWGVWSLPESGWALLGDVAGRDVLEYGCGAAGWSIALAQRGARVTGLDNSARQLEHARSAIAAAGVDVRLVHSAGESTPFAAASFDLIFCDHGAMSFAAPELTIPEVARIARRGAGFVFCLEHPLHAAAWDDALDGPSRSFQRPYFTLDRTIDPGDEAVSFVRPISAYLALLDAHGFALERLLEPQPRRDSQTTYTQFVSRDWAIDFPAELVICARRR
jgi:SAM-dependent methyltransferase